MKNLIFIACLLISVSACNQGSKTVAVSHTDTVSAAKKSVQYTCPMDADVVSNKPGKCSKCGMELVKK